MEEEDARGGGLDVARDVGREDDHALARLLQEDLAEAAAGLDVEPGGGLVHDQDGRRRQQGAGDAHPLAHAARVVAHLAAGVLGEAYGRQQPLDLCPPLFGIGEPPLQGPMVEELLGREAGIGVEFLGQEADPPPVLGQVVGGDRHPPIEHLAARGLQQAGEHAQQGGLAGAVRPQQAHDAGGEGEAHAGEGPEAAAVDLGEAAHLERGRAGLLPDGRPAPLPLPLGVALAPAAPRE